ncbi:MAG: hypothetical protein CL878_01885 [Dehalococcoidia bacterium]|nr:hypothetical protein [Dehalococcoidia bacterium]
MPVLCHTWQKVMGDHPDESTPMQLAEVAGQFPHTIFVCRHSGGDYEYGAKAMRGLDNVFMDVGGGEAHGGFLLPVRCIVALVQQAIAAGAEIHGREAVTSWHSEGQGVRVTTTRATYRADRLIPTADPCLNSLLHDWQLPLAVERQVVG